MQIFTFLAFASSVMALNIRRYAMTNSSIPSADIRNQFPSFNESQWEAYHCLTFSKLLDMLPPCADYCETYTLGAATPGGVALDGCHEDDFPCHCANSQKISDLIEPCIFPFVNASSTCTLDELSVVQAFVTDSCTFFNATQYADYNHCGSDINNGILADIDAGTAPVPTIQAQAFCSD